MLMYEIGAGKQPQKLAPDSGMCDIGLPTGTEFLPALKTGSNYNIVLFWAGNQPQHTSVIGYMNVYIEVSLLPQQQVAELIISKQIYHVYFTNDIRFSVHCITK